MSSISPRPWLAPAVAAGIAYPLLGVATAELARAASTAQWRTAWRLAAWLLSLATFVLHLAWERGRLRSAARAAAAHVALGVALGAFLLALAGPVRSHWGAADFPRATLLSLPLWPVITGIPAYVVALVLCVALERAHRAPRTIP